MGQGKVADAALNQSREMTPLSAVAEAVPVRAQDEIHVVVPTATDESQREEIRTSTEVHIKEPQEAVASEGHDDTKAHRPTEEDPVT